MKRFLGFISREIVSINHAAYILALSSISSQVLALIRDRLLASSFGASFNLDLYYSAFRIPDILFATVGSLVSASVLLPTIASNLNKDKKDLKDFINSIFTFYSLLIFLSSIVLFFLSPYILALIFPKISGDDFSTLVSLTRILFLSPIFLGFSNLFACIVQTNQRFFISALSPVLYNVGIILGILFLFPLFGLKGLVLGVVLGAFLHFAIQIPFVVKTGLFPNFSLTFSSAVKKVLKISVPRTITVSSAEMSELFLISFASFLSVGSISIFNLSFNLQSVPFSIIGVSYAVAVFPTLSKIFSSGHREEFFEKILKTSKYIVLWSVPSIFLIFIFRFEIVKILLGTGRFDSLAISLTSATFAIFAMSLVFQNLNLLFTRSFYARGQTARPLVISVLGAFFIIISSFFFANLFDTNTLFKNIILSVFNLSSENGIKVLTLGLGYSFGTFVTFILYSVFINKEYKGFFVGVIKYILAIIVASVFSSIVLFSINLKQYFNETFLSILIYLIISFLIFSASFILFLSFIKNIELKELQSSFMSKFKKKDIPENRV